MNITDFNKLSDAEKIKILAIALVDVLDGNSQWYDIRDNTGLPDDRCEEIAQLFTIALKIDAGE